MAQLDPSLVRKLEDRPAELRVFVHAEFSKLAAAAVAEAGLRRLDVFEEIGVVYALGTARNIERLILDHRVSLVEADRAITWHTETSHDATRGRKVWADARDEAGLAIDGRGVTIAINDSGVDGRHPGLAPAVVRNLKLLCPEYLCEQPGTPADAHLSEAQWVDVTDAGNDSDTAMAGWHGTHVASIAAMRPQHSQGKYSGAAPGADLVGLSVGNVATVYGGASGMAWVLRHHAQPCGAGETVTECPPIRVINNSWGPQGGGECLPNGVVNKLQEKLVDEGVVVVWSAGNDGGDGTRNATNPPANCLTPGVISTANYNDGDSGTRDGELAANSSRAMAGAPATYPDIAAPGTNIWAACGGSCSISNAADEGESRYYTWNSGSSMAAPHVAGIVAQMLQASPALRPDQVEDILEDTAHRFTAGAAYERDPLNPGTRTSFDKGHGLVDAWEAVRRAASYGLDRRQSSLGFTLDSATEAQFSDTTSLKARLTDGVLDPIANQDVAFSLSDGTQLGRASTDMSGIAAITPPISIKPGEYELTVSFAGSPTSDPVAESAPFVVTREDSTLELELTGEGASRSLHVRLTEGDNPSTGLAGRVVELSKDGSALTTVITDQNGEARLVTPDESDAVFDASFGGDEFYLESQASTEEPSTPPWKAPIQPGAPYQALGDGTCTFNASFTDPRGNIYMGIAAHCLPNDIGMRVTTKSTGPFGTLVFWDYRYAPTWQDFGLIKIDRKMHKHYSPAMRFFGGPTAVQTGFVPGTPIYHHGYGVCTNNAEPQRPRIGILNYVNGEGPAQNVPRAPMDLPQDRGWFFAEARTCGGDSGSLFNTIDGKALGVLTWGGAGIIQWGPTFKLILEELSQKGWELELMTAPMRDPQGLAQAAVDFMTWCAEHPIGNAQDENACVRADGVSRKNHQIPEKRPEGQPGELIAHGHIVAGGPQTQFPGGSITGLLSLASGVATGEYPAPVNVDSFIIPAPPRGTPIMTRTTDNSGAGYDIDVYFHASKQGGYSVVPECATPDEDEICKVPPSMRFMEIAAYEGADLDVKVFTVDEDPDPTISPSPTPTETPDPDSTETPDPDPTATPDPEPTHSPTPEPSTAPSPTPEPTPSSADSDGDGVADDQDNCRDHPNANQVNTYGDARGDACEPQPSQPSGGGGGSEPSPSPSPSSSGPPVVPAGELGDVTATISAPDGLVSHRAPFTLNGVVSAPRDCARPIQIELTRRIYGDDNFQLVATLEASSEGSWTYTALADRNAQYIATPRSTEGCEGVASTPTEVQVRGRIQADIPGRCAGAIRGRVVPSSPGSRIILQERSDGRWVKLLAERLSNRSRFAFVPGYCGRFRLAWKGSLTNLPTHLTVRLRP